MGGVEASARVPQPAPAIDIANAARKVIVKIDLGIALMAWLALKAEVAGEAEIVFMSGRKSRSRRASQTDSHQL